MVLERRKMDQIPVQNKCWNLVFDSFLRISRDFLDPASYLFQNLLHIGRKAGDVIVDGRR